jgi:hypothetical protein
MNRLLLLLILTTSLFSCADEAEVPKQEATPTSPDTVTAAKTDSAESYLPVKALLKGEVRNVEFYASGILRKATIKGRKDSAFIQLPQFQRIAEQFMLKELDSAFFRDHFEETSFMDQTTKMLNFIYTAKDSASALQKVVVYVQPSETTNAMDRLYFETVYNQGDTLIEKRLTWKIRKYFYILTVKQPKSGNPVTTMEKLIWDPQHFGDE